MQSSIEEVLISWSSSSYFMRHSHGEVLNLFKSSSMLRAVRSGDFLLFLKKWKSAVLNTDSLRCSCMFAYMTIPPD